VNYCKVVRNLLVSKNHAMTVYRRTGGNAPRVINLGTRYFWGKNLMHAQNWNLGVGAQDRSGHSGVERDNFVPVRNRFPNCLVLVYSNPMQALNWNLGVGSTEPVWTQWCRKRQFRPSPKSISELPCISIFVEKSKSRSGYEQIVCCGTTSPTQIQVFSP
jgi:hypothetical protein